jgi:hypothetical protein
MTASTIARLKITLDDVKPIVQRRVEVPLTMRLDRLHLVLQAALGWTNSHLYEIRAGDVGWGMVDPDWGDGPLDAAKARLLDLIEDTGAKTFKYLYDFGDGWEHTVRIERVIDAVPGLPTRSWSTAPAPARPRTWAARGATATLSTHLPIRTMSATPN